MLKVITGSGLILSSSRIPRRCNLNFFELLLFHTVEFMAQYLASQQISLGNLVVRFLSSRALLCVTAVSIGIACRCLITHPISWYECLIAVVLLCCWPRIELYVHYLMHHAQGTGLHERHQWHHQHPHDDSALGPVSSMLVYNVIPLPAYFFNMPIWRQ